MKLVLFLVSHAMPNKTELWVLTTMDIWPVYVFQVITVHLMAIVFKVIAMLILFAVNVSKDYNYVFNAYQLRKEY